ncbi:hypothetical protein RFI_38302, partial [Reticulomyxa filosa]
MHLCYSTSCVAVICLMDTTFKRLLAYDLTPVQLLQLAQSKLSFLFFLLLRIRLLEGEMCVYIPYFFVLFIDNGDTSQRDKKKDGNQRFNYILKYVTDLIELKISNIHFDDIYSSQHQTLALSERLLALIGSIIHVRNLFDDLTKKYTLDAKYINTLHHFKAHSHDFNWQSYLNKGSTDNTSLAYFGATHAKDMNTSELERVTPSLQFQ